MCDYYGDVGNVGDVGGVAGLARSEAPTARRAPRARLEAVLSSSVKYPSFHDRLYKLTKAHKDPATGRSCDEFVWPGTTINNEPRRQSRCYLLDGSGYLAWAPQFYNFSIGDKTSYSNVPLARHEGLVTHALAKTGVLVRTEQTLYQGSCVTTPAYLDTVETTDGIYLTAEEQDQKYAGSPTNGYFPPASNTYGCVQNIVYYKVDDAALASLGGIATGSTSGACNVADYTLTAVNGTNLFLLLVDIQTDVDYEHTDDPFYYACHVENHLRSPGAYELRNGTCEVFEPPTANIEAECPLALGYSWRRN